MMITKGKHYGRDTESLGDDELVGVCFAWRHKDTDLSQDCLGELTRRHGEDVALQLLDVHESKIRAGEYSFRPYQRKPTTPFSECHRCGRKCEVLIERICAVCYGPYACLEEGMSHILNTQQRIDRYFKMGLQLEIVSTGKYRCVSTDISVTANGHWVFNGAKGKGITELKKVLKLRGVNLS